LKDTDRAGEEAEALTTAKERSLSKAEADEQRT
jgi:hypothetical protein